MISDESLPGGDLEEAIMCRCLGLCVGDTTSQLEWNLCLVPGDDCVIVRVLELVLGYIPGDVVSTLSTEGLSAEAGRPCNGGDGKTAAG